MNCDQSGPRAVLLAAATTLATAIATALVEEAREWIKRRREASATPAPAAPCRVWN